MTLKHINHGEKCPICKVFGIRPLTKIYSSAQNIIGEIGAEYKGHSHYTGIGNGYNRETIVTINFYRCRNCHGEFMKDDQIKLKKKFSKNSEVWYEELEKIKQKALKKFQKEYMEK